MVQTDGSQPVGQGIGPALEARDVLAVLRCEADAPQDLRHRSIALASALLELAGAAPANGGEAMAAQALDDGRAWTNFNASARLREGCACRRRRATTAIPGGAPGRVDESTIARLRGWPSSPARRTTRQPASTCTFGSGTKSHPVNHCVPSTRSYPDELAYALDYAAVTRYYCRRRIMTVPLVVGMPGNEAMTRRLPTCLRRRSASWRSIRFPMVRPFCDLSPIFRGA